MTIGTGDTGRMNGRRCPHGYTALPYMTGKADRRMGSQCMPYQDYQHNSYQSKDGADTKNNPF